MRRSTFLNRISLTAAVLLAGAGAALAQSGPLPSSPSVPTPYQSPLFHAGGALTPGQAPYTAQPSQLQGTPTALFGVFPNEIPTQIPSFLLGNYDPNNPPGVGGALINYPNHFGEGNIYSWTSPFNFVPTSASTVTLDDSQTVATGSGSIFAATGAFAQVIGGDVAGTATNGEYQRLPPNTNGTATWTLRATAAGSYSVYFHIPDDIQDTSTSPVTPAEPRSVSVFYSVAVTGAFAQTVVVTASQTEANSTQFLAGPFQIAAGDTVTVTLTRDSTQTDPTLKTLNQNNTADYLVADSMTLQATIGDVQSTPTAISYDYDSADFANAKYWGIYIPTGAQGVVGVTANQNALPDYGPLSNPPVGPATVGAKPFLTYGNHAAVQPDGTPVDGKHSLRQLVYYGRSDPTLASSASVDNVGVGFTSAAIGTAVVDTTATGGSYFVYGGTSGAGTPVGKWTLTAPANGTYFVTVHIPGNTKNPPYRTANPDNRIPDASYTIAYGSPAVGRTVTLDQTIGGDISLPTGAIPLLKNQTLTITLNNGTASAVASPQVVADSVTMTTGSATGAIYCVDGFTGGVLWRFETPPSLNGPSPPVFSSPAVAQIHVMTSPGDPTATPVKAPTYANKLVVIVGDNNGLVYCLDAIGNGDGTSNANALDPTTGQPITIPQPTYGTTTPPTQVDATGYTPHVGTTSVYWIYRPDPNRPKYVTGANISKAKAALDADPNSDLPVPASFGSASPTILVNPAVTATNQSDAIVFVGNSNGVLYALNPIGVPYSATNSPGSATYPYGDSFNASQDLRSNTADPVVPTCQPAWWFTLRGANPNSTTNASAASIESAPAVYINTKPLLFNGVTYPYHPIVYIGSAHEQESTSNIGRLYALNGLTGPAGNSGKTSPLTQPDPTMAAYSGPGSLNYNIAQRPQISPTDTADWSFPDAYGKDAYTTGKSSNLMPRPALGNITGSPVVFTDTNETGANADGTSKNTRIYFAANVGIEVPATPNTSPPTTPSTTPAARPDDTTRGRVWAVNLDGSVGTTTNSGAVNAKGTNVWAYPTAFDPNIAGPSTAARTSPDDTAEPYPGIGSFLHMTPAIGFVQFPANITPGTGTYTPTDVVHPGGIKGLSVPMLYVGTRGADDTELYYVDIDGDMSNVGGTLTDRRSVLRYLSPDGAIFQSSPILITNSTLNGGNGGSLLIVAGNTLYDFGATPTSNVDPTLSYPMIRLNRSFVGFGPLSSPAVAASNVKDLFASPPAGPVVTDWVYVGDSSTGYCRGITPNDPGDALIPTALGDIVPPPVNPPLTQDLTAIIHSYIYDGSAQHPANSADITQANPVGPTAPLPVFEWGQNAYLRFSNVVPPNLPTATNPYGDQNLFVRDSGAGTASPSNPVTYYTNGGPITFRLSDATGADGLGDTGTVPASVVTALPADGFILRTDSDTSQNLVTMTGKRWMGAYTYAIGDGTARRNTPGARRRVIEATQTVQILLFDGTNFAPPVSGPQTTVLRASATNGNAVSVPILNAQGAITGYQSNLRPVAAVDQPTFGILNPLGVRGGAIPLPLTGPTTAAVTVGDELGPFRGVLSPPTTGASGDTFALQALANGDTIYANAAPPSTSGVGSDPTRPLVQSNDTSGINLPQVTKVVVTATGLVPHNGSGDNLDETTAAAPPTGQMSGSTTTNGLSATNFGSTSQPYAFDLFDRSALGLSGQALRVKIGPSPEFGGKDGLYWNDNTPAAGGGFNSGGGSVVNPLAPGWETMPLSYRAGVNTSPDYPDISPGNIAATLHASTGSADLTSEGAVPDGATASGGAVQSRIVTASPTQFHVTVPRFQPANQQLYRAVSGGYSTTGEVPPSAIGTGDTVFPMGYVSTKRIYVPNQYGRYVDGCAYRDIRVYTGVPVDMSMNMVTPTADIGKVPSGFGIQTATYGPLGFFTPFTAGYQANFQPLQIENLGNVNLLNVHLDQKQDINTVVQALPLFSDPLDSLISIPGYDYNGITGPRTGMFGTGNTAEQPYLVRSSLDTDLVMAFGHNPGVNPADYPGATFHKALVSDAAPSNLTVPDVPHDNNPSSDFYMPTGEKPQLNAALTASAVAAPPFVSVAIPFGTPVGTYSAPLQIFEGIDLAGYRTFSGTNYPINPPQYGGATGGNPPTAPLADGVPAVGTPPVAQMPLSATHTTLKATVLEDRMTDNWTFGALPQIDAGPAIAAVTNANGVVTTPGHGTPDFAPAAFRDPTTGDLSVYWTSGRATPYNIYGVNATFRNGAFMPNTGDTSTTPNLPPSWWTSIGGYNNTDATLQPLFPGATATNSGLTITQDATDPNNNIFAFSTNVTASPYRNVLSSFSVAPSTGKLTVPQAVTTDTSQVKYGAHGLNTKGVFGNSAPGLWAFWTTSTRGRTAIYYNSTATANAQSGTNPWPATTGLLPVPAGLTSVADPAPLLIQAPSVGPGGVSSGAQWVMEVTFSGSAPDGSTDLYQSRYTPGVPPGAANNAAASQLVLASYPTMTEILTPPAVLGGWYQARDVAWSRTGALNLTLTNQAGAATPILYDNANKPLFSRAVFDKASGLLVLTGVSLTGGANGTVNVYVDLATGRVRFTVPPPAGAVLTATFNPLARRITNDPRADTAPTTFLDTAQKANGVPSLGNVEADRRWYVWRKSGVSGDPHTTTLYEKTQRLTVYLPKPVDATQAINVTVGGANYSGSVDVHNFAQSARLYFPILAGSAALEGQTVTVSYTATDTKSVTTLPDTIQWQDEQRSNDSAAPPPNTLAGLTTTLEYAIPLDQAVNENNVSAFLDPDAYKNTSGAATYPHKVWLFWNSTRNGTADLYYETIDPKF